MLTKAACMRAGGVLQDDPIAKLAPHSVRAVFAPKVDAALNLQRSSWATPQAALNAFSSVASFIGSAGQGNYAAANSVLDAWAGSLQAAGVSGTCSNPPARHTHMKVTREDTCIIPMDVH